MLERSIEVKESPWALYSLAILNRDRGDHEKEVELMLRAFALRPDDVSLAKEVLRCLYNNKDFEDLSKVYESMPLKIREEPRCMIYYAFALLDSGNISDAENILYKDGGILLPDIRECETITLDLWIALEKRKAEACSRIFDEKNIDPPTFVDFRMFSNADWLNGGEIIKE